MLRKISAKITKLKQFALMPNQKILKDHAPGKIVLADQSNVRIRQ